MKGNFKSEWRERDIYKQNKMYCRKKKILQGSGVKFRIDLEIE